MLNADGGFHLEKAVKAQNAAWNAGGKQHGKTNQIRGLPHPGDGLDAVVVGSGAAGYNAADWLYDLGCGILRLSRTVQRGTSRNTGSDKQTYYKLSLAGMRLIPWGAMAQELFDGEGVDGDIALAEAAGSVRSFIKLANLGVFSSYQPLRRICGLQDGS